MKLLKLLLPFFFVFSFSQQKYFIVTIEKFDSAYPKENQRFYWIINSSDKNQNIQPVYFLEVDEDMKDLCNKNNSIGIFNRSENTLTGNLIEDIFTKIYKNRTLQLTTKNKFSVDNRTIKYKLYTTAIITDDIFSCNIDKEDGNKIKYQGKVYFINKNFSIDKNVLKNELDKLESINLLNFSFIRTNPYERVVFK